MLALRDPRRMDWHPRSHLFSEETISEKEAREAIEYSRSLDKMLDNRRILEVCDD